MGAKLTKDHHLLTRNLKLNGNYLSNDGGDEGIRITDAGLVGIGNPVPGATLEVSVTASQNVGSRPTIEISSFSDGTDDARAAGVLKFHKSANDTINAYGSGSHTVAGEVIGRIEAWGVSNQLDASEAPVLSSYIEFAGDATANPSDAPGKIVFATSDLNDDGTPTVRMTLNDDGNVGIGVTDPDSLLEVFGESAQLKLSWDASNHAAITVDDGGGLELVATGTDADITLDSGDDIILDVASASSGVFRFKAAGTDRMFFNITSGANEIKLKGGTQVADYFTITTGSEAATTIATVSGDTAIAHITIVADGHVEFDGCAVGFDKETTTFAASDVIEEANDSTDIDFRLGNKHELTLTDDLAGGPGENINFIFPATSGNFLLVLIQGVADCTIATTAWQAYASDESLCNNDAGNNQADGRIRWAGGGAPTLSTSQYDIDIVSIYWDADNQTAFAVISQDF